MCVSVWEYTSMCAGAQGGQRKVSDTPRAGVTSIWELPNMTELRSSGCTLNHQAISPGPKLSFLETRSHSVA